MTVGFIGLGTMGAPIAGHLLAAGESLVVWNRTPDKSLPLAKAGATVASSASDVLSRCDLIIVMVTDEAALDEVLGRTSGGFAGSVRGRTIVSMGTISADHSAGLARDIASAGGLYVEAPVSGSRRPAELGRLIAMVAGDETAARRAMAVLAPACHEAIYCGLVPNGLLMKHATNFVLIPLMVALSEAAAFVRSAGLDPESFARTMLAGQMACDLLRAKLPKIAAQDYAAEASVANVLVSTRAAGAAARAVGSSDAMIEQARRLLIRAIDRGLAGQDILALSTLAAREEDASV